MGNGRKFEIGNVIAGYSRFGIVRKVTDDYVDFETYTGETIRGELTRVVIVNPDNYFPGWILTAERESVTGTNHRKMDLISEYNYLKGVE